MTQPEGAIPLADLIEAVRGELQVAALNARDQDLQFEVQEVNLEVEVATTGTREGKGGLQIWVLTLGARGSKSNAATNKISLTMNAVRPDGTRFVVSDLSAKPVRRK